MNSASRSSFQSSPASRQLLLALAFAAGVWLLAAGGASAAPLKERVVISTGHTDLIDVRYEEGELSAEVHDDTVEPSISRPIQEVLAHVKPEAETEVPSLPEYEFIGPGGSAAWLLPQTQDPNLLWPGWRTSSLPPGAFAGAIKWRLLGVDGPGQVTLFSSGVFGEPSVIFNSAAGFPASASIPLNSHVHANWTFGAEGVYRLIFGLEGTLAGGASVSSGPLEYRFFVGDLADLPDQAATDLSITGLRSRYQAGQEVLLATAQSPDTGFSDYRWSRRCPGEADFAAAGEGAALWFDAVIADDGCQYRVALHDADGELVDASDPVTLRVGRLVLSVGHTDAVAPHYEDGQLRLRVKDDTDTNGEGVFFHDPSEVIFHAKPESMFAIPPELGPEWEFIGAAGEPLWMLPMTEDENLLWPGFSAESIALGQLQDEEIEWSLEQIEGPGRLNLWIDDAAGRPIPLFKGGDPLPQSQAMPVGLHAHFNWGFGAAGLYTLTFEAAARRLEDGGRVRSGPTLYRFFVGDLAELPEIPYAKVAVTGLNAEYMAGETVTLGAAQSPDAGLDDYRWSRRCGEELALTPVGSGASLSFPAGAEEDGCEYFLSLDSENGIPVAISTPARLSVRAPEPSPSVTPPPGDLGEDPGAVRDAGKRPAPQLGLRRAKLRGRWLVLDLRLSVEARVRAIVKRGGKVVIRSRPRPLAAGRRVAAFELRRKLARGRYAVVVRAHGAAKPKAIGLRVK